MDYRPCIVVYHFTNLVIGTNVQLQEMSIKASHKVCYFLLHLEYERLMETISKTEDLGSILE